MDEPFEPHNVVPELYFLIAKFLSGGPLKETAKTLLKELESVEVLPQRLDWEGGQHAQSYDELSAQYAEMPWQRLANVCSRALRLAENEHSPRLAARLSLLSETLVASKPQLAFFKQDQSLVRRLVRRELGLAAACLPGGRGGRGVFPARLLASLQLQRRTLGHLSAVYCLVFECTGRYVITGADDLLVKVWSARDGRLVGTLRGAGAEITDASVSPDGSLVACGSVERLVRVWALPSAAPRAVLHAHAGTITSVQWAPPARADVRWLASTSTDGSVAFWTCSPDGQFLSQPVQYVERMRPGACHMICAAWSAGGAFLAAGSADHHVRLYAVQHEPAGPRRILETAVHGDAVDSIAWAHRGLRFVSGSKDGSAALWTLHATQWRHSLLLPAEQAAGADGKKLKVTMVCWDCSDAYVITAVSDCTIRVWCATRGVQLAALRGHRDEAYVLEAHPFLPGVLLSAGHDGQLFVWHAPHAAPLASFHNNIPGQGDGAIFDAKWSASGAALAASDSHGHLLLLGLGQGHKLLRTLPTELFYHTDYRPLVRDALGGALDEQTETPPHLMPPPFLVDVEGAPHPPEFQRLVPGRENLTLSQLIPHTDVARNRIDIMIQVLAAERSPPGENGWGGLDTRGIWRNEGVRHTAGSWQRGEPLLPTPARPMVPPLAPKHRERIEETCAELNAMEQSWYRREMRRRPLMINTAPGDASPARRARRAPHPPRPPRPPRRHTTVARVESPESESCSDTSDSSVRLSAARSSASASASRSSRSSPARRDPSSSSSSSQYSDWEAGSALAPPARARRRPARYSPPRREPRARAEPPRAEPAPSAELDRLSGAGAGEAAADGLPEAFRPGEWVTSVAPRKAPYHPQMGDHCLYFRLGHQRYFEAVAEKDLYKVHPRDKPWEQTLIYECELVKVVGIKYVIKPPRIACVRLACEGDGERGAAREGAGEGGRARSFTVRYHDMPDVIDFLVLRQQYDAATRRRWAQGDRFRCMIDDSWWTGVVLERAGGPGAAPAPAAPAAPAAPPGPAWAVEAASHFLSLRVRWDNGEVERLSPWDLEPIDPERLPAEAGGAVPVLPHELEAALYRAEPGEWPPRGDRAEACRAIAQHIGQVMTLAVAEPFLAPVDLQQYPTYARVVPYPVDLATIRARFHNLFYRRTAAAQFDARYLASNAERFNEPHAAIVRQARLLTDLLLYIISGWRDADVMSRYHELTAAYRSSDDEPLAHHPRTTKSRRRGGAGAGASGGGAAWVSACEGILMEVMSSADAEPFRNPVSLEQAPDYRAVVSAPMDLGAVARRLARREYAAPGEFCADMRRVFSNSRLYNTNKRSRIYSMTVRLSARFESLCESLGIERMQRRPERRPRRSHRPRRQRNAKIMNGHADASSESDSEPLAATSRRVHSLRARPPARPPGGEGGGGGAARGGGDDSWDSDVPLHKHSKGKGIGKKSKSSSASAEPVASTSAGPGAGAVVGAGPGGAGAGSSRGSSACTELEVLEEELLDDVHLTYTDNSDALSHAQQELEEEEDDEEEEGGYGRGRGRGLRKRARGGSDSAGSALSALAARARRKRRRTKHKRTRERFEDASSSSSNPGGEAGEAEAEGEGEGRRYESDHSYQPRYSTDDDAPLHLYRQRADGAGGGGGGEGAGPSGSARRHNGHARSGGGGVSLRARSPRRYNEDSSDDSAAAISKRTQHHRLQPRRLPPPPHPPHQSAGAPAEGAHADHNYYNGNGHAPASSSMLAPPSAVSISSRGRVRKLTPKARGLLRE